MLMISDVISGTRHHKVLSDFAHWILLCLVRDAPTTPASLAESDAQVTSASSLRVRVSFFSSSFFWFWGYQPHFLRSFDVNVERQICSLWAESESFSSFFQISLYLQYQEPISDWGFSVSFLLSVSIFCSSRSNDSYWGKKWGFAVGNGGETLTESYDCQCDTLLHNNSHGVKPQLCTLIWLEMWGWKTRIFLPPPRTWRLFHLKFCCDNCTTWRLEHRRQRDHVLSLVVAVWRTTGMESLGLRRTQSLRSLSGAQERSWVAPDPSRWERKSVFEMVRQ